MPKPAPSLQELKASALKCRTPKQFRELLNKLQALIPYRNLFCGWGYTSEETDIGFMFNHGYPVEFVRWSLTKGMLRKGPVFQEWLRIKKTHAWADAAKHLQGQFDPEFLDRMRRFNLQYSLGGGLVNQDGWIYFAVNMGSDESCRAHLKRFDMIVPAISRALKRACPRPLLSNRETAILERRAMGERIKQIAAAEAISERTVRMHLQRIKKKLYTDDLVNAVVIAVRSGMIHRHWKEWHWRKEHSVSR